jgi:hypothetical protein
MAVAESWNSPVVNSSGKVIPGLKCQQLGGSAAIRRDSYCN